MAWHTVTDIIQIPVYTDLQLKHKKRPDKFIKASFFLLLTWYDPHYSSCTKKCFNFIINSYCVK